MGSILPFKWACEELSCRNSFTNANFQGPIEI